MMDMMKAIKLISTALIALAIPIYASAAGMNCDKVHPEDPKLVKVNDDNKINDILKAIPFNDMKMSYKNIGERLPNLHMKVKLIVYGVVTADEVCSSGGALKKGDMMYQFSTSDPNEAVTRHYCQISSRYVLIKRANKWLAQDRTGNFLMNNRCEAPSLD